MPATDTSRCALSNHVNPANAGSYSPDGGLIVLGSEENSAIAFDTADGRAMVTLVGHERRVIRAGFSHDGAYLDCQLGQHLPDLGCPDECRSLYPHRSHGHGPLGRLLAWTACASSQAMFRTMSTYGTREAATTCSQSRATGTR